MIKKNIAVVGCGWLGLPLAEKFVSEGHTVHGTTRSDEKLILLKENGIVSHKLNFNENHLKLEWLKQCDVLILNIPPSNFQGSYAQELTKIVESTNSFAKIIFISSTSVYPNNNSIVDENTPLVGETKNARAIIEAEQKIRKLAGKRLTIIRMAGLVGGERHPVKFMSGKFYKNGENPVNLIHLDDCIQLIQTIIKENVWGQIINGCCLEHPSKSAYYTFAAKKLTIPPPNFKNELGKYKKVVSNKHSSIKTFKHIYASPFDFPY